MVLDSALLRSWVMLLLMLALGQVHILASLISDQLYLPFYRQGTPSIYSLSTLAK